MTASQEAYVLAVDGGGTKCLAMLVGTRQGVISAGRSGGCNPQSAGRERAVQALAEAIAQACVGLPHGQRLRSAAFGLAGLDSPKGVAAGRELVSEALAQAGAAADTVLVENDGLMALRGAAGGGRGMLIVGGTGSVVYATADGMHYARAGGWGHRVGDVGSAHMIARNALITAYRAFDGFPVNTELPRYLCRQAGVADMLALQDWLYGPDVRADATAALAKAVDEAAADGDPAARSILMEAGRSLGELAAVAACQAGLPGTGPFPVFLVGGVLQHAALVRQELLKILQERCPGAAAEVPRYQPIFGAILLALGGGAAVDPALRERLLNPGMEDDRVESNDLLEVTSCSTSLNIVPPQPPPRTGNLRKRIMRRRVIPAQPLRTPPGLNSPVCLPNWSPSHPTWHRRPRT